jgi:hypothetical protein
MWLQVFLTALVLIAVYRRLTDDKQGFKRVGPSIFRQLLPGGGLIIFHTDEYIKEGYETVSFNASEWKIIQLQIPRFRKLIKNRSRYLGGPRINLYLFITIISQ